MSGLPFVELGDLDGTHGLVRTKGFVSWVGDVASHRPYQRVGLSDDSIEGSVVCTVWTDEITLEQRVGYEFVGADDVWPAGDEVQLKLYKPSWATEFWRPE